MDDYSHHVSGFFAHREEAEGARSRLAGLGLPLERIQLFDVDSGPLVTQPSGQSNEVLTNVLVDGAVGTVVGTGIGALAQLAIVAGGVSLFVASPLVAPLIMLGWGASLAAGAGKDIEPKEGWLSDLVRDAIASGQVVLVAQTRNPEETEIAREVIGSAVGEYNDVVSKVLS